MPYHRSVPASLATGLFLLASLTTRVGMAAAMAQDSQAAVTPLAPDATAFGMTLSQWATAALQWTYSIPKDRNPADDLTGKFSGVGQRIPVWFLPHPLSPGERTIPVIVPGGQAIFLPAGGYGFVEWGSGISPRNRDELKRDVERIKALISPVGCLWGGAVLSPGDQGAAQPTAG
jgi:hypothetical protein